MIRKIKYSELSLLAGIFLSIFFIHIFKDLIIEKKELWVHNQVSVIDIDEMMNPIIRPYKSGKYFFHYFYKIHYLFLNYLVYVILLNIVFQIL